MITVNIDKARAIAHDRRRSARANDFAPLDQQLAYQIPGTDTAAIENARQVIRDKYAAIQTQIDEAADIESLKVILALYNSTKEVNMMGLIAAQASSGLANRANLRKVLQADGD